MPPIGARTASVEVTYLNRAALQRRRELGHIEKAVTVQVKVVEDFVRILGAKWLFTFGGAREHGLELVTAN